MNKEMLVRTITEQVNLFLEKKSKKFKQHKMYHPKTGEIKTAKKEKDHEDLAAKGYIHLDPKIFAKLEDVLEKEGGASGMKPFKKALPKNSQKEIEVALKSMDNVGQHKKGDYILGDKKKIKISQIAEIIEEEINFVLEKRKKKRKKKKKKKKSSGKKDACYYKVKARYSVWPSAYASGALVKCRKVGAANWGNKSKKK
jgi:hypothetical protein